MLCPTIPVWTSVNASNVALSPTPALLKPCSRKSYFVDGSKPLMLLCISDGSISTDWNELLTKVGVIRFFQHPVWELFIVCKWEIKGHWQFSQSFTLNLNEVWNNEMWNNWKHWKNCFDLNHLLWRLTLYLVIKPFLWPHGISLQLNATLCFAVEVVLNSVGYPVGS